MIQYTVGLPRTRLVPRWEGPLQPVSTTFQQGQGGVTLWQRKSLKLLNCRSQLAAVLLKKAAGLEKASGEPNKNKVGKVTKAQVKEIAETKMPDLNANTVEAAMRLIEGTARSMGIEVVD